MSVVIESAAVPIGQTYLDLEHNLLYMNRLDLIALGAPTVVERLQRAIGRLLQETYAKFDTAEALL